MDVSLHVVMDIPGKEIKRFDYDFSQSTISLGRDETNDVQIPLSTVSRNHCVLREEHGEWFIRDLKSTHGTKLNGRLLGAGIDKRLRHGDEIDLIHFKINFKCEALAADEVKESSSGDELVSRVLGSSLAEDLPYLRVMNGPDQGKHYRLPPDLNEVLIGRHVDCDFHINDPNISRHHALIKRDWTEITIRDNQSKNGVVLNQQKVKTPTLLRDGDEILLGALRLTYIDPSAKFLGRLDDIPELATQVAPEVAPSLDPEDPLLSPDRLDGAEEHDELSPDDLEPSATANPDRLEEQQKGERGEEGESAGTNLAPDQNIADENRQNAKAKENIAPDKTKKPKDKSPRKIALGDIIWLGIGIVLLAAIAFAIWFVLTRLD